MLLFTPAPFTRAGDSDDKTLKYPQGMTGPQPQRYVPPPASAPSVQQAPNHLPGMATAPYGQPMSGPGPEATSPPTQEQIDFEFAEFQAYADRVRQAQKAPLTVDQALNYLTKIEKTFEDEPGTYRAFVEIMHKFRNKQKSTKDVYKEVSRLLKGHAELLAEFWQFLPDGFLPDGFCRQLVRQGLCHRHAAQRMRRRSGSDCQSRIGSMRRPANRNNPTAAR